MNPYVSFVVAARNDNYGGDFLHRMQVFINCLFSLSFKYKLNAELVVVEWNPPRDRDRLKDALLWPDRLPAVVRIIEVPSEVHNSLPNSDRIPLFEYIAKNVGIRRSTGDYVLSTNPDLLYSEELIRFLAEAKLSQEYFYRVDRYDVDATVPLQAHVAQQLDVCARHVVQVNILGTSIRLKRPPVGPGRFLLFLQLLRHRVAGYRRRKERMEDRIHVNAPGDFFLMKREQWFALHGFPELTTNSHVDTYMCVMAASSGLRQRILPGRMRLYHQEHERAVAWDKVGDSGRPVTSYQEMIRRSNEMLARKRPEIFQGENWGLADTLFQECRIE